jgi:hypothetical protein
VIASSPGVTAPRKNVFVLGLDDRNLANLRAVTNADAYEFRQLLRFEDLQREDGYPFREVLDRASEQLDAFDGSIDAIISYWDFPATSVIPILCKRHGLPAASLESVLKCEHKYWSRIEQAKVLGDHVPLFEPVNPFDPAAADKVGLAFPFWLKPIKAHSSQLGFRIHDQRDLREALARIRANIWRFGDPFNDVLTMVDLPPELDGVDGNWCIAEQMVHGSQCTVEGYVLRGEPTVYGVIDSVRDKNHSSFLRYQYPSHLPTRVQQQMSDRSCRLVTALGYDNATFNIEFFWDARHDRLSLLEINPRLSQSHSDIFARVDGVTNLDKMVEVALGNEPVHRERQGEYGVAAKCFLRHWRDARVLRVPSKEEVRAVERLVPGVHIEIAPEPGRRLSDMINQDSYSYELALMHIGAQNQHELLGKFQRCSDALPFELAEVGVQPAVAQVPGAAGDAAPTEQRTGSRRVKRAAG